MKERTIYKTSIIHHDAVAAYDEVIHHDATQAYDETVSTPTGIAYVADDGKEFASYEACNMYEHKLMDDKFDAFIASHCVKTDIDISCNNEFNYTSILKLTSDDIAYMQQYYRRRDGYMHTCYDFRVEDNDCTTNSESRLYLYGDDYTPHDDYADEHLIKICPLDHAINYFETNLNFCKNMLAELQSSK